MSQSNVIRLLKTVKPPYLVSTRISSFLRYDTKITWEFEKSRVKMWPRHWHEEPTREPRGRGGTGRRWKISCLTSTELSLVSDVKYKVLKRANDSLLKVTKILFPSFVYWTPRVSTQDSIHIRTVLNRKVLVLGLKVSLSHNRVFSLVDD